MWRGIVQRIPAGGAALGIDDERILVMAGEDRSPALLGNDCGRSAGHGFHGAQPHRLIRRKIGKNVGLVEHIGEHGAIRESDVLERESAFEPQESWIRRIHAVKKKLHPFPVT